MAFFVGGTPRLTNQDPLSKDIVQRGLLKTVSSGTVQVEAYVILRNFSRHFASEGKY